MRRIRRSGLSILACAAVLAALGGVAYAATSSTFVDASNHINTCLPPSGGQLHVWHPGHGCSGGWQALAFPATATAGATGPQGVTGPTGMQGATGPMGPVNPVATTVNGETVTKVTLKEPTPGTSTTVQTLYSGDGLTILADCDNAGNASLQANGPASADAELTVDGIDNGATVFGSQTNTLGPTSFAPLGAPNAGQTTFSYATSTGAVVTGSIGYQHAPAFGAYAGCGFFGTLTSG